jgi:hypothetical protein
MLALSNLEMSGKKQKVSHAEAWVEWALVLWWCSGVFTSLGVPDRPARLLLAPLLSKSCTISTSPLITAQ